MVISGHFVLFLYIYILVAEFLFCISRFIGITHCKVNNGSSL